MGKLAQGPMTMRMLPGENLVGAVSQPANNSNSESNSSESNNSESNNSGEVLIGTNNGGLIRVSLSELRRCKRGDLGEIAVKLNSNQKGTNRLVSICESADLVGVITNKGRNARIENTTISMDKDQPTQLRFKAEEKLVQLVPLLS